MMWSIPNSIAMVPVDCNINYCDLLMNDQGFYAVSQTYNYFERAFDLL